jgi:hypothetical protein
MNDEDFMRALLSDAVSDIEPVNRLHELHDSLNPSPKVVPMARSRSWYAATGIIATAAVIGAIAYVTSVTGDKTSHLGPASDAGTALLTPTATATDTALPSPGKATQTRVPQWHAAAVYYLGDGPRGTVLYREWGPRPPTTKPLTYATQGLMTEPVDPDYRTAWQAGWLTAAKMDKGVIDVAVGDVPAARPAAMSDHDATEAIQQVIYTMQAAVGQRAKVQFVRNGQPATTVLGVPTARPLAQGPTLDVLSRMSISDPTDGVHVKRGRLVVTGVNNGFEATVVVRVERAGKVYLTKAGTASGYQQPRLFPWRVVINTSKLPPGSYTIVASNDDPAGTGHPETDTRTIVLR